MIDQPSTNRWGLIKGELIGPPDCPLMRRWAIETPIGSLRVHHFLRSDDERHPHDHPWWFATFVLAGGYTDVTPCDCQEGWLLGEPSDDGRHAQPMTLCPTCKGNRELYDVLTRGSFRFRPALHRHWVKTKGGAWTLIVTGPKMRVWGFWEGVRFLAERAYFKTHGYAACQDVERPQSRERMGA